MAEQEDVDSYRLCTKVGPSYTPVILFWFSLEESVSPNLPSEV